MSRAFVKETAESAPPPERMVADGPNPVTPEGFAQIESHVARLEAALANEANPLLRETLERDLRYWRHQRATAQVIERPHRPAAKPGPDASPAKTGADNGDTVSFGARVTIRRKGRVQTIRLVGVDEADPKKNLISIRSPLAQAIVGLRAGDIAEAPEPLGEIEIVRVE